MRPALKPSNEQQRLESLWSLNILDTIPENDFDQITFLASQICNTPMALISLVDENRQWFKSKIGIKADETHRDLAFCSHTILGKGVFIVPDSTKDERFFDNPLVTQSPNVVFYAGAPLLSPNGQVIGTLCVIDNKPREQLEANKIASLKALSEQVTRLLELRSQVTTLKKAEENVKFKTIAAETIVEGIVIQNKTGNIIEFNPAALNILNLNADQLLGKSSMDPHWRALKEDGSDFPGDEHPAMICLRTGEVQKNVIMGIRNSSSTRWIKINSVPIFETNSKIVTHSVTSFTDISDQLNIQMELEKKRSTLKFILDSIPNMVGFWNSECINLQANMAYSEYFQKTPTQIRGIHIREVLGEERYLKHEFLLKKVLNGEKVTFERTLPHQDGSLRHLLGAYIPNLENGKVVSFLSVIVDITELRNSEIEKRNLEVQLAESAKLAVLGEMASGVAHEINNPLVIIKGKVSRLIRKFEEKADPDEPTVKDLRLIETTANRIARIVKALRTYSRDAGDDEIQKVLLSNILNDTLELCRERFAQANIEIRVKSDPSLCINCRATQISHVIMSLLSNSFDAIIPLQNKWIEIILENNDGKAQIVFTDSGNGIAKDVAIKMMQPFFTTKDVGKGSGLGLSVAMGIIESHGGTLKYDGAAKNTTFTINLPLSN